MRLVTNHDAARPPRVLVALDGSEAARAALPIAARVAEQSGIELDILHVSPIQVPEDLVRDQLALGTNDEQAGRLYIHVGKAAAGILEMANDPATELVVLSTHGYALPEQGSLGRVAEAVINVSRRPILLVRPESEAARPGSGRAGIRSLLFPLDGTPSTAAALRPAIRLACRWGASVDLLYVLNAGQPRPTEPGSISQPYYVDQPQHEWPCWSHVSTQSLIAQTDCPHNVPVNAYLAVGDIGPEILRFATLHKEDAIVLVRRSCLEPEHACVLRTVLDQTTCPVLLLGLPSRMPSS